jgi:hypothetical protein
MDPTKDNVDEQMAQLREALREIDLTPEDLTIKNTGAVGGSLGTGTVTLNGSNFPNTITAGGYTISAGLSANTGPYYTTGSTSGINWNNGTGITANPWTTTTQAGRMELNGDHADLVINGVSLLEVLQERLNVMIPNPELEKEWDQLRALGEQYRAVEKDLKEKAEMWKKLNATE